MLEPLEILRRTMVISSLENEFWEVDIMKRVICPVCNSICMKTNAMENFIRQLRKLTKNKNIFPNYYSLQKNFYLAMVDASSKLTSRIRI